MGRVSRYRKVKPCDTFYRGPKKDIRKDDLRPENEDEQPIPKSLLRLMKSAELAAAGRGAGKRQRRDLRAESSRSSTTPQSSDGKKTVPKVKQDPMFQRQKGESLKAYLERVDIEANAHIMESFRKNRKMREKRKTYLQERRKKLKARRIGRDEEPEIDFADMKDEVQFGEVVSAPPRLSAKPRGSHSKPGQGSKELLLHDKLAFSDSGVSRKTRPPRLHQPVSLKRKEDLELERNRAVEAYRQAKKVKFARSDDD